jgi:hypothetical protein
MGFCEFFYLAERPVRMDPGTCHWMVSFFAGLGVIGAFLALAIAVYYLMKS